MRLAWCSPASSGPACGRGSQPYVLLVKMQQPLNIGLGLAIGVAIGVAMDNVTMGIGIGIALAIALSLAFKPPKDRD